MSVEVTRGVDEQEDEEKLEEGREVSALFRSPDYDLALYRPPPSQQIDMAAGAQAIIAARVAPKG